MVKKILSLLLLLMLNYGYSQRKLISELKAYPNPFRNKTTISFESSQEQGVILTIKNILGKTVYNKRYYAPIGQVGIEYEHNNLKPGLYIYTLRSIENTISKRFLIKQ